MQRGKKRHYTYFVGDFETTVYPGQTSTEVWAAALVPLYTENVSIFHSIDECFNYLYHYPDNIICYFHNLKFDGQFWLYYLLHKKKFKQAIDPETGEFLPDYKMPPNTFSYTISDRGQWYLIRIKCNHKIIELRDSLKLIPFSVKVIGKNFETKHRKLDMEYKGFRYAGCNITPEEQKYIANDVLVVKEALEIMFREGHTKLTIGSCCQEELINSVGGKEEWEDLFPDLTEVRLDADMFDAGNADQYIRHSYRGGWCYAVPGKTNKIVGSGFTADVNSLYPSMMSSESGSYYPVGYPTFWKGNFIPDAARREHMFYFIRIKTRFYIKKNMLPFVQIKGSMLYKGTEMLTSSDVLINRKTGEKSAYLYGRDGSIKDTRVTLTMTCTDFELFLEHYNVIDFEILDGCFFHTQIGIFDNYINKYKVMKINAPNKAVRTLAKLYSNNAYGQLAKNDDSSFRIASLTDDDIVHLSFQESHHKKTGYIAVGSAITSYARRFTITAAQSNFYGEDQPGFIYADTDSIHCNLRPEEVKGIKIHDKNYCCWKLESCWDQAKFIRQKTYMEHVVQENLEDVTPYWNIKCAGLPDRCKDLFLRSMKGEKPGPDDTESMRKFLETKRSIDDFAYGLKIPGKLIPKTISGGVVLIDSFYEIRG